MPRTRDRGETDPELGVFQGQSVARRFTSPDGMTVLVGRTAADNDVLTLRLASPRDFWLHVAADEALVFDEDLESKWERAIAKLGVDLSLLSGDAGHA